MNIYPAAGHDIELHVLGFAPVNQTRKSSMCRYAYDVRPLTHTVKSFMSVCHRIFEIWAWPTNTGLPLDVDVLVLLLVEEH